MEEFNHPELAHFLLGKTKLPEKEVATIIRSLLECLSYLKDKGVCHRDIKTDNILYNQESQ